MNHLKPNTSGIDCEIKDLQTDIYDALVETYDNVEGFGKVYSNPVEGGSIPEVFVNGLSAEYQEVYLDDTNDWSFGFIIDGNSRSEGGSLFVVGVKVFFWVNLDSIRINERDDAEAHRQIGVILKDLYPMEEPVVTIETGANNVFRGFVTNSIKTENMHPYHLFSFNFDINYSLNKTC